MKKIFLFCAAMMAAMTMSAQQTITCAQAKELMPAQQNDETEVEYIVVGYVTALLSNPSPSRTDANVNQQRFYMDDEKGSVKTVNCYWCDLPAEYKEDGLNVGDKISVKGKIINYNNEPEIKNGPITMIERASINIDTYDVNTCEALEEGASLNAGDTSDDIFRVHGRLKGVDDKNSYGQHTFEMACGEDAFKAYLCAGADLELGKGDSVVVIGKLYNYNGTIEISNGKVELIEKSQEEEVILPATVAEATSIALALDNNKTTADRYAITGYVDSIASEYNEQYGNISFYMTDNMENPTYTFEAYRVKVYDWQAARIEKGVQVTVTASLQHYHKDATDTQEAIDLAETVAGGTLVFVGFEGINNVSDKEQTIKRIENGQVVIIRNNVKYNALGAEIK